MRRTFRGALRVAIENAQPAQDPEPKQHPVSEPYLGPLGETLWQVAARRAVRDFPAPVTAFGETNPGTDRNLIYARASNVLPVASE